jgi:hypothetical protein
MDMIYFLLGFIFGAIAAVLYFLTPASFVKILDIKDHLADIHKKIDHLIEKISHKKDA